MMHTEHVILVDHHDQPIGTMEKMEAHRKALLHRAFSVFIFNDRDEMLIHRRAFSKYHSGGLWTNACCSHPRPDELTENAAVRRLQEEMGFTTEVEYAFSFIYKAPLDNELTEHEFDHVFIGYYNETPQINPEEVEEYRFISVSELMTDVELHPNHYTVWFKIALPRLLEYRLKIAI